MFYRSGEFKLLEAGVKLTQMQQELHAHNIANLETPGYKAKSLAFRDVLREEANGEQSVAAIHAAVEENEGLALRPDGNNVDYEAESLALYKTYVQQSMLLGKVKSRFSNYSSVLNCNMK